MKILRPIIYIFAAIGFAYVAFGIYISYGPTRSCRIDGIAMVVSPNSHRQAKLVIKRCNDTNDPMVVLSISDKSDPRKEEMSDIGIATTTDFELTWVRDENLRLGYPSSFNLTQRPHSIGGVRIELTSKPIFNR